jgi:hypothetical protein
VENDSSKYEVTINVLRIIGVFFLCFIYLSFFWFINDGTDLKKLIGLTTLALGAVSILCPIKVIGIKYWFAFTGAFYAVGLLLLVMV